MVEIRNGDCLQLMKDISDGSVDMILCDLPYGTTQGNKWDVPIDTAELWAAYKRIIKPDGAILLFSQFPFCIDLINGNRKWFRYEWVWEKACAVGFFNANRMPLRAHENILAFYDKLPTYNPQKAAGKPYERNRSGVSANYDPKTKRTGTVSNGDRFPRDVLRFPRDAHTQHPTQKPVALLEYLVKTYTNVGETVLDNCMGSGSTGVACVNTGRNFIGFEMNSTFYEIAKKRLEETQEQRDSQFRMLGFG